MLQLQKKFWILSIEMGLFSKWKTLRGATRRLVSSTVKAMQDSGKAQLFRVQKYPK